MRLLPTVGHGHIAISCGHTVEVHVQPPQRQTRMAINKYSSYKILRILLI